MKKIAILTILLHAVSYAERPNIILVMADDQGWGDMAYNGHPVLKTPNFDKSSALGLRFDRFYAAAPVCSPTRASVLTGRHPNRMGVFKWGYPIRPQEITVAEVLSAAGYATGHFGKWHLGSVRRESPASPGENGFDEWLSAPNFFDNDPILSHKGQAIQFKGESSIIAVDAAIDWISKQSKTTNPFFAVVWFGSPHLPHLAIGADRKQYVDQPENLRDFYGEITGMDRAFGKLRNSIETLGINENTILWYCSDNGALPNQGSTGGHRGFKGQVYEGGLLVPAILEWPAKIKTPRTTSVRCNTCDIFPTLVEIVSGSHQQTRPLDGQSLISLIDGKDSSRSKPMGFWDFPIRGIRTPSAEWMLQLLEAQNAGGDLPPDASSIDAAELPQPPITDSAYPGHSAWLNNDLKLHRIEANTGEVTWELYDLSNDRHENHNLIQANGEKLDAMKAELEAWLKSVVDSLNGNDYL